MTDENVKAGGLGATLTSVNGISKSAVWILGDDIGAPGRIYPDNPQGTSSLGCVKAGTNITIAEDGTISATGTLGSDWANVTNKPFNTLGSGLTVTDGVLSVTGGGGSTDWSQITNKPLTFAPPIATNLVLGGVKQGTNITIAADGTISATGSGPGGPVDWKDITNKPATFTPPIATTGDLGGIKVGTGLNVSADGTLTADASAPTWNEITGKPATFTPPIASDKQLGGVKEGAGINIEADGTINTVAAAPEWSEVLNKPATFPVAIATDDSLGGVIAGPGVNISPNGEISVRTTPPSWDEVTNKPTEFNPPIASRSVLGGVKQGNNISIDPDGTINAAAIDIQIASSFTLGGIKVGNGLTIQEDGTLGTDSAAPYWTEIVGKPEVYPPSVASDGIVGGIMPDDNFSVSPLGLLSGRPFTGRPFAVVQYDDTGKIIPSYTMENRKGNLILGGTQPTVNEDGSAGAEVTFGGGLTLLDKTGKYRLGISNDSLDYDISFTNGPNIKPGFLPFVTQVVGEVVSVAFGSIVDAIGYATGKKLGVVQVGGNIDVDTKGVISVKTADKSNLGLMIAGANLNVEKGVVTPAKATTESPGIVQVGTGLSVDAAGVLSTTNTIAFVNRVVITNNGYSATETTWTLPEGVDYFRVRVQGAGGNGGWPADNANQGPGGGGGGGGAYMETMFYGYKFPAGQVFNIYCGAPSNGSTDSRAEFRTADGKTGIGGGGGTNGESGNDPGPKDKGYACGGQGGKPIANGTNLALMQTPIQAPGGDGLPGLSAQTPKGYKTVGGGGGSSYMSPGYWGGYGGSGNGTNGAGEANGNVRVAVAGGSLVIIEY